MADDIDITQQSPPPAGCSRPVQPSLPSEYEELDPASASRAHPSLERRKALQTYVASAVSVAWFICLVAIGQTALRSLIVSLH